jgi:hypothetical protein
MKKHGIVGGEEQIGFEEDSPEKQPLPGRTRDSTCAHVPEPPCASIQQKRETTILPCHGSDFSLVWVGALKLDGSSNDAVASRIKNVTADPNGLGGRDGFG